MLRKLVDSSPIINMLLDDIMGALLILVYLIL